MWGERVSSFREHSGVLGRKVAFLRGEIVVLEKSGMVWEEKWPRS